MGKCDMAKSSRRQCGDLMLLFSSRWVTNLVLQRSLLLLLLLLLLRSIFPSQGQNTTYLPNYIQSAAYLVRTIRTMRLFHSLLHFTQIQSPLALRIAHSRCDFFFLVAWPTRGALATHIQYSGEFHVDREDESWGGGNDCQREKCAIVRACVCLMHSARG